jgi:hypothetical protein
MASKGSMVTSCPGSSGRSYPRRLIHQAVRGGYRQWKGQQQPMQADVHVGLQKRAW